MVIVGVVGCIWGIRAAWHDEEFYRAAEALTRHSADIPFQIEYYQAAGRHAAYIFLAIVCALVAAILSVMLFALAAILARLERLEQRTAR
jgi:hypothetical protein